MSGAEARRQALYGKCGVRHGKESESELDDGEILPVDYTVSATATRCDCSAK